MAIAAYHSKKTGRQKTKARERRLGGKKLLRSRVLARREVSGVEDRG